MRTGGGLAPEIDTEVRESDAEDFEYRKPVSLSLSSATTTVNYSGMESDGNSRGLTMDPNTLAVWKNLETRLDIPFRQNMVDLVLEMARDRTTDPRKIATWMVTTSTCICYAIFGTDNPTPLLSLYSQALEAQYPDTMKEIYEIFSNDELVKFVPSNFKHDEFTNVLWAAGSTFANDELKLIDDEININRKGLNRFRSIWKEPTRKTNRYQR